MTSFAGGDGSAEKPFEISTDAALAYLAEQVNKGNSYKDACFVLTNDIDLAKIKWTPIGNGTYSFGGIFDGLDHTIKNLSLPYITQYIVDNERISFTRGTTGLFGSCVDAAFRNLDIVGASVMTAEHEHMGSGMKIGVLCGYVTANTAVQFENIGIIGEIGNFGSVLCTDFDNTDYGGSALYRMMRCI